MIKFSVPRLEKEDIELAGTEPPEFLGLGSEDPLNCSAPVEYSLTVQGVSGGALVRGRCSSQVSGICGRCLVPVTREVAAEDIELFLEIENSVDELDISEDIREELALELPMNLLCKDDCKGLCPRCGADLNKKTCSCRKGSSEAWNAFSDLKL